MKSVVLVVLALLVVASSALATNPSSFLKTLNGDAGSNSYNATEGLRSWILSKIDDCDISGVENFTCRACKLYEKHFNNERLTDIQVFDNHSLHFRASVYYSPARNQIIIVHRGSRSSPGDAFLTNWILGDLNIIQIRPPVDQYGETPSNAKIHNGFHWVTSEMQPLVTAAVRKLLSKYPSASLAFFGHSLGAACSRLSLAMMRHSFPNVKIALAYTTGTPRTGNYFYAAWNQAKLEEAGVNSYQIVHHLDPVPLVPMLQLGYVHESRSVWYYNQQGLEYKVCRHFSAAIEDLGCFDQTPLLDAIPHSADHGYYFDMHSGC